MLGRKIISLETLESFDPGAPSGWPRRRFRCPLPGPCTNKEQRSFDVDLAQGCWTCHRCNQGGKLGDEAKGGTWKPPRPPANLKPRLTWQQTIEKSIVGPLAGSPGQKYLEGRGIPLEIAVACGVRFAGSWHNRASVLFDIKDGQGKTVAVQGRAIVGDGKITVGPKKFGVFSTPYALEDDFAIVEAPIDAISLLMLDVPAVATCGSGLPDWLPAVAKGKHVYIATDNDLQGNADFWGFNFGDESEVEHPTDAVTLNGKGWADILEDAGATVSRLLPTHAGQINPRTRKVAKDWNDELDFKG